MNGMIDWFARNTVAANLLMAFIAVSGLVAVFDLKEEIFPEFSLDMINIEVPYLGAAPEEVEEAVCVRIEEAIQGVNGIKQITSTASEGMGVVMVELELGADARQVVDDVKSRVDAITTFPAETEKPIVRELTNRQQVIDVVVSGDTEVLSLKRLAERVRDELSALPEITQVEVVSAPPYEIAIEVSEVALLRYGMTFDTVADAVRRSSLDLPGGSVRADSGEILLRTVGQAYWGTEFEDLVVMTRSDGTRLHLSQVATVVDGFAETDQSARFDSEPTVMVSVFRTGDQSAIDISAAVRNYLESAQASMPASVSLTVWQDQAQVLKDRVSLLVWSGLGGFALVFVMLALFLELRLAFWVSLGIPLSFLGAIALMPALDVSINVMSLFAFIVVLGIVVDDAIVVGENIYRHQEEHGDGLRGSIEGAREISRPVVFAVLTTVAAFMPLMFVPGMMGKIFQVIPLIVVPCLIFSLVESLNILPAHLSRLPKRQTRPGVWTRTQRLFSGSLRWCIDHIYGPVLEFCLGWRYLTAGIAVSTLIFTVGMVLGGWTSFQFFPAIEADSIAASITLPQGTPAHITSAAVSRLETSATELRTQISEENGQDLFRHIYMAVADRPAAGRGGPMGSQGGQSASNVGEVMIELAPADDRPLTSEEIGNRWKSLTGPIPEAVELTFTTSIMNAGEDVNVQLIGTDIVELQQAADAVKTRLGTYVGVSEISDSFRNGKEEMKLGIRPRAETLGLSLADLGRQVRQAFYGEEAQRIQRGRDDIRVMVRYPQNERRSLGSMETMRIRTADGGEVPFRQVATVEPGRGYASITRVDRNRVVNVTAAVDPATTSSQDVIASLQNEILPEELAGYPGVRYSFEGEQAEMEESINGLQRGFLLALLVIFALLAVPLGSYVQPLIIMSAIPFGLVGAIWGHMIMGLDVTIMSMFGLVALTGVVVNDSLVMVDFINRRRSSHTNLTSAVRSAGATRFRPILLTSLTTFAGLVPLMTNESFQAAFLVPMAVSLGFGVLFATAITLVLVPSIYLILEDLLRVWGRISGLFRSHPDADASTTAVSPAPSASLQ